MISTFSFAVNYGFLNRFAPLIGQFHYAKFAMITERIINYCRKSRHEILTIKVPESFHLPGRFVSEKCDGGVKTVEVINN